MEDYRKRMLNPITKSQIKKVLQINDCLMPEHWNKGMYDAFKLGYGLGKQESLSHSKVQKGEVKK